MAKNLTLQYNIVECSDGGICLVPDNWLLKDDESTMWPPYKKQYLIDAAVKNFEEPADDWLEYEIKKLYSKAQKWDEANKKLQQVIEESDAEAAVKEAEEFSKRGKKKLAESLSWSDDESSNDDSQYTSKKPVIKKTEIIDPPMLVPTTGNHRQTLFDFKNQSSIKSISSKSKGIEKGLISHQKEQSTPQQIQNPLSASKDAKNEVVRGVLTEEPSAVEAMILSYLQELIVLSNQNQEKIKELEEIVKRLPMGKNDVSLANWDMLPFTTREDFLLFEDKLKNDTNLRDEFVKMLKNVGGSNDRTMVNNICEKVMSDEVGVMYSRKGQKGKENLEELMIGKKLLDAMIKSSKGSSETQLKTYMGFWLSGRKSRINNKNKNVAEKEANE